MNIFSINEAEYYCSTFNQSMGISQLGLKDYLSNHRNTNTTFDEGTTHFIQFRDCLLREVERLLFLTAVHYKRSHDMLADSSCAWAHVTMYYGSYYSALSLLGLFGAWVDTGAVVYVTDGTPGQQKITIRKDNPYISSLSTFKGTHERFWDLFYATVASLAPVLPQNKQWHIGISPVINERNWLTRKRNDINYNSVNSLNLILDFQKSFRSRNPLVSLPGDLKLQYQVFTNLTEVTFYFAKKFKLKTDALQSLSPDGKLKKKITEKVVFASDRRLLNKSKCCQIF